ncbi:MAG: flagellar hook-associated protein FlgK [Aquificota bacterium]|nr:flagellar hook-associated protein FlgK [Aquificota bacterium]
MFGASFGIISQALEIYRKSLDIRNRNVINANNPDYVEENPVIKSFPPAGINLEEVRRDQNVYYLSLRNSKLSLVRYLEERSGVLGNVEGVFQELFEGAGISDYTNRFYRAYLDLMKNPTNDGAKSELYNSAKSLADFLKAKAGDLDRLDNSLDFNLRRVVTRINELVRKIYVINRDITVAYAQTYARGRDYKNLLDERDLYLRELSELINIEIQEDEIGRVKVLTSMGFTLVDFQNSYWGLRYAGGRVFWDSKADGDTDITDVIESGKIKALLDARNDIARFRSHLDRVAKQLISEVKVPRENSGTWFLIRNVPDPDTALSTYSLDGNLTFYLGNTAVGTVSNYGSLSLNDLVNAINSDLGITGAGFSATLVANPDGTYTLRIDNSNLNARVEDSGGNIYESSPVFEGTGIGDIDVVQTLVQDLDDLDFDTTDIFSGFANVWWENTKGFVNDLVEDISTTQADVKDKLRIESALLESLERRLQEMQGISIDKEFMEIMRIQRTYEAVARIVRTIDELIQTTLNMV